MRHGDSGKKPFIAHFDGGARYVARSGVASLRMLSCALGARLFPPPKWAGLFPSAAYRRSAPPQLAWGILTPCGLGCLGAAWKFCGIDEWADSHFPCRRWAGLSRVGWDALVWLGGFCKGKGQREAKFTLAFLASHEACCRMAVCTRQAAGSRVRPASREACRRAAVKPRPTGMSPEQPCAPQARSPG